MSQPANDDYSQHLSDDEASYHEDTSDSGTATNKLKQQQQQVTPTTTTISNIKLPILKNEEILSTSIPQKSHVVEKERKARTILLMAYSQGTSEKISWNGLKQKRNLEAKGTM
ncbi:hypothetical protein Tco_1090815 [Tanacetum coccineum]|uniref:Uncharacterized protein n=1 Tax=Tanacetum coccineum TaxID=301880 RepID=A0ABQ5I5C4_9ASTR